MAFTTPRTWTDGELVTASIMNVHVRDNLNAIYTVNKMKSADETVTSSATLQDDADFFFTVAANEKWAIDMALKISSSSTADFKCNFTVPAGATYEFANLQGAGGVAAFVDYTTSTQSLSTNGTGANPGRIQAFVVVGATAGTVQFQWAQNTSEGTNTILKTGSWMNAMRCA